LTVWGPVSFFQPKIIRKHHCAGFQLAANCRLKCGRRSLPHVALNWQDFWVNKALRWQLATDNWQAEWVKSGKQLPAVT